MDCGETKNQSGWSVSRTELKPRIFRMKRSCANHSVHKHLWEKQEMIITCLFKNLKLRNDMGNHEVMK